MLTPEDELDRLDEELGRRRRRLWSMESAPYDGRAANTVALEAAIVIERGAIRELERDRHEIIATRIAEAEGFS